MSLPAARETEAGGTPPAVAARPRPLRTRARRGVVIIPVALLLLAGTGWVTDTWVATPSAADLQARVAAIAAAGATQPLRPSEVPPVLARALVAAEDERFYYHHGLDTVGTARAVWDDVSQRCLCEGGSTVTQQLAKLVYYPGDGRISRKLPSMAVALKIEARYGKALIMADYWSVVPTGYGLVGAREASCAYFGHDLSRLSVAEAAELAGVVQGPSIDDPRLDPGRARARRQYALERMGEIGFITAEQLQAAAAAPVLAGDAGHSPRC